MIVIALSFLVVLILSLMAIYNDRVLIRAGATPDTYDGAGQITLNDNSVQILGVITSNSLSVYTDDEGVGIGISFESPSNWQHRIRFPAGGYAPSGPATNTSVKLIPQEITALDLPGAKNTLVEFNITTLAGDTQTGTNDVTLGVQYHDGNVPSDILDKYPLIVPFRGCNVSSTGVAVTAETALTTFTLPSHAQEIIGIKAIIIFDGAVTASQEITGFIRLNLGVEADSQQNIPVNGGIPNLGTEVEGHVPILLPWIPMHIPLPGRDVTVRGFSNLASALTGGVEVILAIAWR